jgi:hypothetical protein
MLDDADLLAMAEQMNEAIRQMSDLMKGAVTTLMSEGWTEEQAREVVVSVFTRRPGAGA